VRYIGITHYTGSACHSAVHCAIPGTRRREHMEENAAAGTGTLPSPAFWQLQARVDGRLRRRSEAPMKIAQPGVVFHSLRHIKPRLRPDRCVANPRNTSVLLRFAPCPRAERIGFISDRQSETPH
jgi:hypothetical protein